MKKKWTITAENKTYNWTGYSFRQVYTHVQIRTHTHTHPYTNIKCIVDFSVFTYHKFRKIAIKYFSSFF